MSIRVAVHVGPQKTGSTSVQRALVAERDRLTAHGVFYPPTLPDGQFPEQHADIARMLLTEGVGPVHDWVLRACDETACRGCNTLVLSSENFRAPKIRHLIVRLLRRHHRQTGGETRLVYVRRDPAALARSQIMARLDGELGFFFRERYDLRRWAADFWHQQQREVRFFERHGASFIQLEATQPTALAAEILRVATDRDFSFVNTGKENITSSRLAGPPRAMLAYGLRVMQKIDRGNPIVGVTAAEVVSLVGEPTAAAVAGYQDLLAAFKAAVTIAIESGFADAQGETIWHYRWRLMRRHLGEVARLW
jgi:hypothetical protein